MGTLKYWYTPPCLNSISNTPSENPTVAKLLDSTCSLCVNNLFFIHYNVRLYCFPYFIHGFSSTSRPFAQTCFEYDGVAMPGDRSICRHLFGVLPPQVRVKTDMRQNTASQNLCDGWGEYRQNAYIS